MEAISSLLVKVQKLQQIQGSAPVDIAAGKAVKCAICQDDKFIPGEGGRLKRCQCVDMEISMERLKNSGLAAAFGSKRLDTFRLEGRPASIREAYNMAIRYVEQFETIRQSENNWLALLGQVGCGKTHLTIGIANALMAKNISVVYMPYRDEITRIKQVITDEAEYNRVMNRLKNAQVLVVDDLFKEALVNRNGEKVLNESDLRIMFELFNHRYFKRLPVIISSEHYISRLLDMDEGLGSRIFEMTKGNLVELWAEKPQDRAAMNYRMTG